MNNKIKLILFIICIIQVSLIFHTIRKIIYDKVDNSICNGICENIHIKSRSGADYIFTGYSNISECICDAFELDEYYMIPKYKEFGCPESCPYFGEDKILIKRNDSRCVCDVYTRTDFILRFTPTEYDNVSTKDIEMIFIE